MVERRAVDAVIWGAPAVTLDMMRQAYFRDAKASFNDIVWWPKGADWKNQSLDVDTSVRYLYVFSNTKNDGPLVLDLPAANASAQFLGTIMDTWQVPLTDVGVGGKGGKFLIRPRLQGQGADRLYPAAAQDIWQLHADPLHPGHQIGSGCTRG